MKVTGFNTEGVVIRNSCEFGSPRPRCTLHPSSRQVVFIARLPRVLRTMIRVSAAAFAVPTIRTKDNNRLNVRFIFLLSRKSPRSHESTIGCQAIGTHQVTLVTSRKSLDPKNI